MDLFKKTGRKLLIYDSSGYNDITVILTKVILKWAYTTDIKHFLLS